MDTIACSCIYVIVYLLGRCIQLQKCTNINDEQLMWIREKTPSRVVLHNCKGTPSPGAMQQFFRGVANTLKVSLNGLLYGCFDRLALVAQSVSAFGC